MSDQRISVAELRAMTDPGWKVSLDAFEVVALVEAVEAAQAFAEYLLVTDPGGKWDMPEFGVRDALARFDFGPRP